MKTKLRRCRVVVLLSFVFVALTCAFVSPGNDLKLRGPLRHSGPTKILTFAERVSYQRAIEEVYWRHRIWPRSRGERPDPKPSLDAVVSQARIEKKVEDYLWNSQALEDYWQRPVTPEQLQAEMDRMGHHTKQPQVLREIFQALGDDPFVIAECLARPVLAERLVMQLKNEDRVKLTKIAWSQTTSQLRLVGAELSASRKVAAIDSIADAVQVNRPYQLPVISNPSGVCTGDTWTATSIINAPAARSSHTAVWTGTEVIVWGGFGPPCNPACVASNTGGRYDPSIDSWTATSTTNAPDGRASHTAVWTGTEMIVWGGNAGGSTRLNTGGRYNPVTDSWVATSTTNAPAARDSQTALWTDTEMIVWGGEMTGSYLNTGGRYVPSTDTWTATSTTNAPSARFQHTAVWTGSEMIVWGGYTNGNATNTGGRYDPGADSWTATSTNNATDRELHSAVWTGTEMIVWAGYSHTTSGDTNTGGRYNPGTDSWTVTSTTNAPTSRERHTGVWTANEMIVWGGQGLGPFYNTGGRYDPGTDTWTATSTTNAPTGREAHTAVWTGNEMIVWGGIDTSFNYLNTGGRYCAQSRPSPTPTASATATATSTVTPSATATSTVTARITPLPRSRPTPAPRP